MGYLVADCCHMQLSEGYAVIAGMVQLTVCSAMLNVGPLIPFHFPKYGVLHQVATMMVLFEQSSCNAT